MSEELVLGIDIGTTTVKVVAVRASDEVVVGSWSCETKAFVANDAGPLASEQDVVKIMSAIDTCMTDISRDLAARITKIGVSGQMHGLVMWTRHSQNTDEKSSSSSLSLSSCSLSEGLSNHFLKLSNLYTWQDGRCSTEFLSSLPTPESHLRIATGFGCCTLFWLNRHEPGCLERYCCAGTVQDLVVTVLCNLDEPLMSCHNAASWGYFDPVTASWNTDMYEIITASLSVCLSCCLTNLLFVTRIGWVFCRSLRNLGRLSEQKFFYN